MHSSRWSVVNWRASDLAGPFVSWQRPEYDACPRTAGGRPRALRGPSWEIVHAGLWAAVGMSTVSLVVWIWMLLGRGFFWRTDRHLVPKGASGSDPGKWPAVSAVVPARNEAALLPLTPPSLLSQDYSSGRLHIYLVDDQSDDGTGELALRLAARAGRRDRLTVTRGAPLAPGWAGKVWALHQGARMTVRDAPEFLLLTDADIVHPPDSVRALVAKARDDGLDLTSLMVRLRTVAAWERLLIPAFVYFFAMLYPFRWSNDPRRGTAAAAGGCVLVRREALLRAGGFESIAAAVIDDCALARRIKDHGRPTGGRISLGLTQRVRSLRPYDGLDGVWNMVARSGFAQLGYSLPVLVGTVLGMILVFILPPLGVAAAVAALVGGQIAQGAWLAGTGLAAWVLMALTYLPTCRWYGMSPLRGLLLPVTAGLYTAMTVDSALRHWRGAGGGWKGRTYNPTGSEPRDQAGPVPRSGGPPRP